MTKITVLLALLITGTWMNDLSQARADTAASGIAADSSTGNAIARPGKQIRRIDLGRYTLTYHLLDLSERGEMMKVMGHHSVIGMSKRPDVTNHLMVYIQKPDGTPALGEAAYRVTGPDGKDFKTMTMGMYGGYGADIIMNLKGTYTIRAKVILGSGEAISLEDEFTFSVK